MKYQINVKIKEEERLLVNKTYTGEATCIIESLEKTKEKINELIEEYKKTGEKILPKAINELYKMIDDTLDGEPMPEELKKIIEYMSKKENDEE